MLLQVLAVAGTASALAAPASAGPQSLYVVGCGVMGQSACLQWKALHPSATVYGETASDRSHAALRAMGVEPVVRSARGGVRCEHHW